MLDVSYAGTPLVGEYLAAGTSPLPRPAPGDRYPGRTDLPGTRHHLLIFGAAPDADIARLRGRWHDLVDITRLAAGGTQAGLADGGAVLVRPDGYIGFRAAPADQAGLRALDSHLDGYLVAADRASSPAPGPS
jgi:6-methylpretetramide 4-monooxygenase / 4-hydroxy-6-methylpretetramide 12a-monooxygenase